MKNKILLILALSFLFQTVWAQSINDDFNGTEFNTNIWQIILPLPSSQVTETNGFLTLTGRGTLATLADFNSPVTISGIVTMNNSAEHFEIALRTDLSVFPPDTQYHEINGIVINFSADGNEISIQQFEAGNDNPIILSSESFVFNVGKPISFKITDDKTNITLTVSSFGQTSTISATNSFGSGNKIAFESREFSTTSSSLDSIAIKSAEIDLIKSVKPKFSNLNIGTNYQLQVSGDLNTWTNHGSAFVATNSTMVYPEYFDVGNWNSLYFRFRIVP